jgi:hypothetical protein
VNIIKTHKAFISGTIFVGKNINKEAVMAYTGTLTIKRVGYEIINEEPFMGSVILQTHDETPNWEDKFIILAPTLAEAKKVFIAETSFKGEIESVNGMYNCWDGKKVIEVYPIVISKQSGYVAMQAILEAVPYATHAQLLELMSIANEMYS